MATSVKTSAAPAQPKNNPTGVDVFEWYDNLAQRDIQHLYSADIDQRQRIHEIISELSSSSMYLKLVEAFQAELGRIGPAPHGEAIIAFAARMYIAGTLRGEAVLD